MQTILDLSIHYFDQKFYYLLLFSKNIPLFTDTVRQIYSFMVSSKPKFVEMASDSYQTLFKILYKAFYYFP